MNAGDTLTYTHTYYTENGVAEWTDTDEFSDETATRAYSTQITEMPPGVPEDPLSYIITPMGQGGNSGGGS